MPSPLEEFYADLTPGLLEEQIKEALQNGVDLGFLFQIYPLRLRHFGASKQIRTLAQRWYPQLLKEWEKENEGVAPFFAPAAQALVVHDDEGVDISFGVLGDPHVEWSRARELLYRIDAIGENAKVWIHEESERAPHQLRVYGLATEVISAVDRKIWRDKAVDDGDETTADAARKYYDEDLALLKKETEAAEASFLRAAEHSAQAVYTGGVFIGCVVVVALSEMLGVGLFLADLPAADGIALPAGALGATISVMQRAHNGNLTLEYRAVKRRLRLFGAFRPLIGGVLGMVVFAILQSGQLPAIQIPHATGTQLAFFGLLGFLSGFNERFAQDFVTRASGTFAEVPAAPTPAAPTPTAHSN